MRIGFGYDSHVFEEGKPLRLGGVEIPGADGLKAHSDGDVLAHALIDAMFGSVAMGDIGSHFPDTDEKWRGADSMELLAAAAKELEAAGWKVVNADITVVCEKPRLRPHVEAIVSSLASRVGCGTGDISVKGKTNEKMDDIGSGRGIAAYAAVLVERISRRENG